MTEKGSILLQLINSKPFDNAVFLKVLEGCSREDVNSEDTSKLRSLLFFAAQKNLATAIHALVDKGANIDAEDEIGFKPIDVALHFENKEAVLMLAKNGARTKSPVLNKASGGLRDIYNSAVQGI